MPRSRPAYHGPVLNDAACGCCAGNSGGGAAAASGASKYLEQAVQHVQHIPSSMDSGVSTVVAYVEPLSVYDDVDTKE